MWVVKRHVRDFKSLKDFADVYSTEVAQFNTEAEAAAFATDEDARTPFNDVWHSVAEA